MSTRSNVIVKKSGKNDVILYHHCDGYPSGVGADLNEKLKGKENVFTSQGALCDYLNEDYNDYERENCLSGDIEYLYTIDMDNNTIMCETCDWATGDPEKVVYTLPFGTDEDFSDYD